MWKYLLLPLLVVATATARDGFKIGQMGERNPLTPSTTTRFKQVRARLRGNGATQPAYKIAKKIGIDSLADKDSFKERLTTLERSEAGTQLLNRLAQHMHKGSEGGKRATSEFVGLLDALKSSLETAETESESMWTKIHSTCAKAEKSADRQIVQLESQLKIARGAQTDARKALGTARDLLTSKESKKKISSLIEIGEIDTANSAENSAEKVTEDPKESWRKSESGKTETFCPGNACIRTRTVGLETMTTASDPSDLVECYDPKTNKIQAVTKWHAAKLETSKVALLNKGFHTGACEQQSGDGDDTTLVPDSPKTKLYSVLKRLSTNLQDSNAQPSLEGKLSKTDNDKADDSNVDKIELESANNEGKLESLRAQADGAMTDAEAATSQITSLGSVLNQETQFKLQIQNTCREKVTRHDIEKKERKNQLDAVDVAIELVHGNAEALQRYLQGKPPAPPPGLEPGQVVELMNPEAAILADKQKKYAAEELENEKLEFASIFGGSATGGVGLVKDITDESSKNKDKDNTDSSAVTCDGSMIWCATTFQCIDPETVMCEAIEVVKGLNHMDTVVQGERSALIFHDSEAEGQHQLQMKLSEERLKYEANKAQKTVQQKKDEEKMKSDLKSRQSEEEAEKKRYREETETLNKLQHKCSKVRDGLGAAKQKLTETSQRLVQATDRVEDTASALRIKSAACEAYANQSATIRASGTENVNKERSETYADVTKLVDAEKMLNSTEAEYKKMTQKAEESKKELDILSAKLSKTTTERQSTQEEHERNVKLHCDTQACALTKKRFEEKQLDELKMQQSFEDDSAKLKELRDQAGAKGQDVSSLKSQLAQFNFNAKVEEEKSESSKTDLEKRLTILTENLSYCNKEKKRLQDEKKEESKKQAKWTRTKEQDEMKVTDAHLAADNICDEKDKFKFKRQEELERSALDLAPVPEQIPLIGMACGLYEDCVSCTADTRCGYASIVSKSGLTETSCMRGSLDGPYFYNETNSGSLGGWFYQTCPVAKCRDYHDCKQCLEAGCGFCGGRLACFEGGEFGTSGDDKGPASCPRQFMPTWAFKTPAQGTSRCPLRQIHLTAEAEKEDIALLKAKKIYREIQHVRTELDACQKKLAPMSHGPEKIRVGQTCRDLSSKYEILQAELLSAVDTMHKASSGGESKTYDMGYKEGLTQAQREAAKEVGYLKGLKEGWEKAQRVPGPAGPAGPVGPKGNDGADLEDDKNTKEEEKKKEVETLKTEIEEESESKVEETLEEEKKNSTKLLNATAGVRAAEKKEKKAKDDVRKAIAGGSEEDRKKAEAELAAANAARDAADKDAKETVADVASESETPVVQEEVNTLENELAVEDEEDEEDEEKEKVEEEEANANTEAMLNERPAEFNEMDVVPSSDDDVCAKEDVHCVSASLGVTLPETFTKSMDANFQIVDEARIQSLKIWNDALSEQIKVSTECC